MEVKIQDHNITIAAKRSEVATVYRGDYCLVLHENAIEVWADSGKTKIGTIDYGVSLKRRSLVEMK